MTDIRFLSPTEVTNLIREGRAANLLGVAESIEVEFKAEPYHVASERTKYELAKDVCAFANSAAGGIIVIGVKTEKSDLRALDVVTEVRPFPIAMFAAESWMALLNDWIYPAVEGLDASWHPEPTRADYGYGIIHVPAQPTSIRPFLVNKSIHEDGKIDGLSFGFFQRRRTDARTVGVHEVQSLLRDGILFRNAIDLRTASTYSEATAADAPPSSAALTHIEPSTDGKVAALISAAGLQDKPQYVLVASANPAVRINELFESADDPIVELLRKPPEIRAAGFDLQASRNVEIVAGQSRRTILEEWKGLEFTRDGVLIFVAHGGSDFLSWATPEGSTVLRINQVALIESVLLFCRLAAAVFSQIRNKPSGITFELQLRGMCTDGGPPMLTAGPLKNYAPAPWERKRAQACDLQVSVGVPPDFNADATAYELVSEVYLWVGFERDAIPYVNREADTPAIDGPALAV